MYSAPEAYLLTFRCYGAWLPGDEHGWVTRGVKCGAPSRKPNPGLAGYCGNAQAADSAPEFTLAERTIAESAIQDLCNRRRWRLHAVNVRKNHVHAVAS